MKDHAFQVGCPSCETLFEVTDPTLVGQIVACPKCGGMMMIEPPREQDDASLLKEAEGTATSEPIVEKKSDEQSRESDESARGRRTDDVSPVERRPESIAEDEKIASNGFLNEETVDDGRKKGRVFLIAGLVCAFGVAALAIVLLGKFAASEPKEPTAALETSDATENNASETDDQEATRSGAVDVALNEEADSSDDVFDVFQSDENVEEESNDSEESVDAVGVDDENIVDDQESDTDDDLGDLDEIDGGLDAADETELAPDDEVDDEETVDDGVIPTDFDEAEFERKNQAEEEKNETDEEDLGSVASTTDVSSQSSLPVLKNKPADIDVDARMALAIHSIVFPESPAAATRLLSEFSGVPIEFDLDRFAVLRPSLSKRLDLKLDDVDVGTALAKEAEMLKWNLVKSTDRIVIEPQSSELSEIVEQRFDVADLLGDATPFPVKVNADGTTSDSESTTPSALIEFVKSLVAPGEWDDGEFAGKIAVDGTELVVTHNSTVRKLVEILLDQLRVLRRLDAERRIATESLAPELRGWETLSKKTSFNLIKPISLQQAASILENKFNFLAIWDDAALNASGSGRDSTTNARIGASPVAKVLSDVLEPFRLNYVILDEKLILITTDEKADSYRTVELHGFATLDSLKTLEQALKLTKEMKSEIASESWDDPEVSLWIDVENGCWIVRQSQPIQRRIREWTSSLLEKEKAKETRKSGGVSPSKDASVPEVALRSKE